MEYEKRQFIANGMNIDLFSEVGVLLTCPSLHISDFGGEPMGSHWDPVCSALGANLGQRRGSGALWKGVGPSWGAKGGVCHITRRPLCLLFASLT
jgi:hypothetical protein